MRSLTIAALAALALPLAQAAGHQPLLRSLEKRQGGDAFIPPSNIVESCAANQLQCGSDWCYTPSEGQVCCKEGYPCPDGSFCLTQGYCCPDGDDPETCARRNGVTLSADFNTAPVTGTSAPPSSSTPPAQPATTSSSPPPAVTPSSSEAPTPPSSPSPAVPYPVPSSSSAYLVTGTGVVGTGTGGVLPTSSSTSLFTGGAGGHVDVGGGLAVVLGLLSYLI